ncbi:hypothetical protein ACFL0Z_03355, partial [Patescibacteria group bacterium]
MSKSFSIPDLNLKIARHLTTKADAMEKQGKNKFQVIAYRKAARTVRRYWSDRRLRKLPLREDQ